MGHVETVAIGGVTLAVIVRATIDTPGVSFFTPGDYSQQLAYMQHPAGKVIVPHVHRDVSRELQKTLEVLIVRKGVLRVDLYDEDRRYVESRLLRAGDVILLVAGGHGFEAIEAVEMFEVKQGPFAGDRDKERIEAVAPGEIRFGGTPA